MHRPSRRQSRAAAVILTAGLCVAAAIKAQDAPTLFRSETRVVVCNTTVVDKNGHLVTDLAEPNFAVFENGVQQEDRRLQT